MLPFCLGWMYGIVMEAAAAPSMSRLTMTLNSSAMFIVIRPTDSPMLLDVPSLNPKAYLVLGYQYHLGHGVIAILSHVFTSTS